MTDRRQSKEDEDREREWQAFEARRKELENALTERFTDLDFCDLYADSSTLDGSFTVEELRAIADAMDTLRKDFPQYVLD